jgi:hypothetical protein
VQLLFKLLLPNKNIDTRTYQMKDKSLVRILSRLLSADAEDIQNDLNKGDVSQTASRFFISSSFKIQGHGGMHPASTPTLTLAEVDEVSGPKCSKCS